jgi:hypothetical protein
VNTQLFLFRVSISNIINTTLEMPNQHEQVKNPKQKHCESVDAVVEKS